MKYAIISDIHANLEALEVVLSEIDNHSVDQILCLGDVVGYNANPNECADIIRTRNIPTICGNHDAVAAGLEEPWGFNPIALAAALWTREHLSEENLEWLRGLPDTLVFEDFLIAHGSPTDRDCYMFTWEDVLPHLQFLEESKLSHCFFGHTHNPGIYSADGMYTIDEDSKFTLGHEKRYFINPGSVGQPRDGVKEASFAFYDSDSREYELVRVAYPVEETAKRIEAAGLPPFLAERLFQGR